MEQLFTVTATINGEAVTTEPMNWMQLADVLADAKTGIIAGTTEGVRVTKVEG